MHGDKQTLSTSREQKAGMGIILCSGGIEKKMEQVCYPRPPGLKFQANSTWFSGGYICKLICLSVVVAICRKLCIYGLEFEVGEDLIIAHCTSSWN